MSINGQVNLINNATEFFAPIVLAAGNPTGGSAPSRGNIFQVTMIGLAELVPLLPPLSVPLFTTTTGNGSFSLPDYPAPLRVEQVSLTLSLGGYQYYRSEFFPYAHAQRDALDIFLYQPDLPASDGISAGQISGVLAGQGLPGNTQISCTPWGLSLVGSQSEASVQFGIQIIPDKSANLDAFLDLALNGWNIHVGWPESWCESADEILNRIRSALGSVGSAANMAVLKHLTTILEGAPLNLTEDETANLLAAVSIQFVTVSFANAHTWAMNDRNDTTPVIFAQPVIGYPRSW